MDVAFFPSKSEKGLELAQAINEILEGRNLNYHVGNRYEEDLKQEHFLYACLGMDLVIFDATREDDTNNFDLANELMKHLPHVVVVSRNYLPVNLFSVIKGGYPDYITEVMTNEQIVHWLEKNLDKFLKERPEDEKKIENQVKIIQNSSKELRREQMNETNVFISFRTKYEKKSNENFPSDFKFSVSELAERIKKGKYHNKIPKTAKYLSNGALVFEDELLTEHRMWQLLSIIDDELIINCDEFWIYGSEDYADSWWTQGELMILANTLQSGIFIEPFNEKKILKFYDPRLDKVYEVSKDKYPSLRKDQIKRKSRLYTTTSPNQMGPEGNTLKSKVKKMAFLFRSPLTKWIFKPRLKELFNQQMDIYRQLNVPIPEDELDFDTWFSTYFSKDYLDDKPFSEKFWKDLKLLPRIKNIEKIKKATKLEFDFEFNDFFDFVDENGILVDKNALSKEIIEIDGKKYKIVQENHRYYFSPSRFDTDFSSTQRNLEVVPTYRFVEIKEAKK